MLNENNMQSLVNRLMGQGIGEYGRAGYDRKNVSGNGSSFAELMRETDRQTQAYHSAPLSLKALEAMDANQDGFLTEAEFMEGIKGTPFEARLTAGADDKDAVMTQLFSKLDQDEDGKLTPEDISAARTDIQAQILYSLDTDQDGEISREERLGFRKGFEDQADLDGDGELSHLERMAMRGEMMRALLDIQEESNAPTDMDMLLDSLTGKTDETGMDLAA